MEPKDNKINPLSYENNNAHSECPECDSLNTYFSNSFLICRNCGEKIKISPNPKAKYYLETGIVLMIILIILKFVI